MFKRIMIFVFLSGIFSTILANWDDSGITKGQVLPSPKQKSFVRSTSETRLTPIFQENFETGSANWSSSGLWQIGIPSSGPQSGYGSQRCAATNLSGNYEDYADYWLVSPSITIGNASTVSLRFWEWYQTETNYDYGRVKISSNGGVNWSEVNVRNGSSDWRETIINLNSYRNSSIKIAFNFTADYSYNYPGWYVDNIVLEIEEPEPLTAVMTSISSQNFPFIYCNVDVKSYGVGIDDLTQSIFQFTRTAFYKQIISRSHLLKQEVVNDW